MQLNPSDYRKYFPILKTRVQLSSCSQSAISTLVQDAMNQYWESLLTEGMNWDRWMEKVNQAKKSFARLIGAESHEIAILASVSDIISSIVTSLSYNDDKSRIITTELDFPCIPQVLLAQERMGAKLSYIPSIDHMIPIEYYEKYITEDTILTCISMVSYYNGFKQDVKEIARIAHKKGSYLFVDAYQAAGNIPIDVKLMDIDMLATGTQKYLLGIPGIAFLYMKDEIAEQLRPRVTGWFGQENPFAFDNHNLIFASGTRRFETGTPPVINAYAATAAFDMLLEIGMDQIDRYLQELSYFSLAYGQEKGLKILSPMNTADKGSTTAFYVGDGNIVEQKMKEEGIIVSARKDVIRIAPHFYNTKDDIAYAIDQLAKIVHP